jgi:hypothetical protein
MIFRGPGQHNVSAASGTEPTLARATSIQIGRVPTIPRDNLGALLPRGTILALVTSLDLAGGKAKLGRETGMKPHHRGEGVLKHTGYMEFVAPIHALTQFFDLKVSITDFNIILIRERGHSKNVRIRTNGTPCRPGRSSAGPGPGRALCAKENSSNNTRTDPTKDMCLNAPAC